jgi:hypothetical protein
MRDSEVYSTISLFIAVLRQSRDNPFVPFDPRAFARVVEELQAEGNSFAQQFTLCPHSIEARKECPGFRQGLSWAFVAGMIAWEDPDYTRFILRLSPRMAYEIAREAEDLDAAVAFAKAYVAYVELL